MDKKKPIKRVHFNDGVSVHAKSVNEKDRVDPLAWPNQYIPINRNRWETIMRVLKNVPEPFYDSLLEGTLALFRQGKRRQHREVIRIHHRDTVGWKGFLKVYEWPAGSTTKNGDLVVRR